MDSALRIDSAAFSGPMVTMVTSASLPAARCASAICRPSSMAYSSSSLMSPSTDTRSTVESEGLSLRSAAVSGTCLTHTTMFMDDTDLLGLLAYSLPNRLVLLSTGSIPLCYSPVAGVPVSHRDGKRPPEAQEQLLTISTI